MTSESQSPPWTVPLDAALEVHRQAPTARYAQLATVGADGRPSNRTVVVRGRLDAGACLLITTDARSVKAGQLAVSPWAEVCWYFSETREQFRLSGRVRLVGPEGTHGLGEVREGVWSGLSGPSKASFAGPPPGLPFEGVEAFRTTAPEAPPDTFVLLVLEPESVDHLDLRPDPHRRVLYRRGESGWTAGRVNP